MLVKEEGGGVEEGEESREEGEEHSNDNSSNSSSIKGKYKYVVKETRVDLEEAAWREQQEKEMQKKKRKKDERDNGTQKKLKKKDRESEGENGDKKEEEEEEEEEEEGDDEDIKMVGTLPSSHYGPLHPLALPVLLPFIALHALLLMAPFRLVAGLTASATPSLPPSLPPSHPPVEIEEVPELIRRHLSRLPIKRVDVFLPGMHTHGTIIVRRPMFDKDGIEVLEHVAARVERVRIREGGKEGWRGC